MHSSASCAACKMCYDSKDNDGTARARNHTDYEVAYVRLEEEYKQAGKSFNAISSYNF